MPVETPTAALPSPIVEAIAQGLHSAYVEHRHEAGEDPDVNPSLVQWGELPDFIQESNREAVREFARRLQIVGFRLVEKGHSASPVPVNELAAYHDFLAQVGHIHWVNGRLAQGWQVGPMPKNAEDRTHPCLVDWTALPKEEQAKDQQQVRDLFRLLQDAGWKVVHGAQWGETGDGGLSEEALERLAQVMHAAYVVHRMDEGSFVQDNVAQRPWETLSETLRDSNRQAARDLLAQLGTLGYLVVPKDANTGPVGVTVQDFGQQVETLARIAHARWLNERIGSGWTLGVKDPEKRQHPELFPWDAIPIEQREKAKEQIKDLPRALGQAGLKLVRSKPPIAKVGASPRKDPPGLLEKLMGKRR